MWLRGADCGRLKEERTVALDFRYDERCNIPDMRRSPVIFVNVHVKGTCKKHLLR